MNTLTKLKRAVSYVETKHQQWLYPGDFVQYTGDGEIYIVVVWWDNPDYKWGLVSLKTGLLLDICDFSNWIKTSEGERVERDRFWEDTETDWEVLKVEE